MFVALEMSTGKIYQFDTKEERSRWLQSHNGSYRLFTVSSVGGKEVLGAEVSFGGKYR